MPFSCVGIAADGVAVWNAAERGCGRDGDSKDRHPHRGGRIIVDSCGKPSPRIGCQLHAFYILKPLSAGIACGSILHLGFQINERQARHRLALGGDFGRYCDASIAAETKRTGFRPCRKKAAITGVRGWGGRQSGLLTAGSCAGSRSKCTRLWSDDEAVGGIVGQSISSGEQRRACIFLLFGNRMSQCSS